MDTFIKYNSINYKNTPIGIQFKKKSTISKATGGMSSSTALSNTVGHKKESTKQSRFAAS